LFAVNHGSDQRGSRPIANDSDKFHEVILNETAFYGWPDFLETQNLLLILNSNHPEVEINLWSF